MTEPRIGSLFSGYGGLDLGVMLALGGRVVWHAEIDPAPARILAARFPGVPNLGDVTAVDWGAVEPVDVLTGGFPCQDVSHAGKRAGLRPDTRSGLWSVMAYVIARLRPRLVVIENVRGLLSAAAHSEVEPCPGCVGDTGGEPALRALGAVLGDLAGLGFDAEWRGLRAADVGAPHGRWREFIVAARHAADVGHERGGPARDGRPGPAHAGRRADPHPAGLGRRTAGRDDRVRAAGLGEGAVDWGPYGPAVARWGTVLGRPAPTPWELGRTGGKRLAPAFVEWMMGLPAGWVTEVDGITRNDQLKALGNGVVPQQAAAAVAECVAALSEPAWEATA